LGSCASGENKNDDSLAAKSRWESARKAMVDYQIIARGITEERLIAAMMKVERHLFVPEVYRQDAYADYPLPIGEEQTISQPFIVALMTNLLELDGNEKVLEIGTGSGYQAAILGELAKEVYTIEIVESLAKKAGKLLDSLEYTNIETLWGDGFAGWPDQAPFDAIIVTCAPPEIPQPLIDQLAEGGRLVIPVGEEDYQYLKLVEKIDGKPMIKNIIPVRFVPMTGKGVEQQQ
jgi:protein-L-isoaspartate(D-aspartate) O-methyltransferase